jgi:hypothetical protein
MSNLKMTLFGQNEHSTPCQNIEVQEIEMVETEMSDNKALMDCSKISSA